MTDLPDLPELPSTRPWKTRVRRAVPFAAVFVSALVALSPERHGLLHLSVWAVLAGYVLVIAWTSHGRGLRLALSGIVLGQFGSGVGHVMLCMAVLILGGSYVVAELVGYDAGSGPTA